MILLRSDSEDGQEAIEELLENPDLGVAENIELCVDAYVAVGKKMHMLGKGL